MTVSAVTSQPTLANMGGTAPNVPAWIRAPFFPTAPWISTNPNVSSQVRFYGVTLTSADSDAPSIGVEVTRTITFDIPSKIIAINGDCVNTSANGPLPLGVTGRQCFLFRAEFQNGDKLTTGARLASTILGSGDNPGEVGFTGVTVNTGGALIIGITPINPIPASYRIDITIQALEIRGSSNFVQGI